MSQRVSGYERKDNDSYETPEWVTMALLNAGLRKPNVVWEPACGTGKIAKVLGLLDAHIETSDITDGKDFIATPPPVGCDCIITNPPYRCGDSFIRKALTDTVFTQGTVAMLLRVDYDSAKGRRELFANHIAFSRKLVLTKRIRWFEGTKGSPSYNHAWFIWDWRHKGPATLEYGP